MDFATDSVSTRLAAAPPARPLEAAVAARGGEGVNASRLRFDAALRAAREEMARPAAAEAAKSDPSTQPVDAAAAARETAVAERLAARAEARTAAEQMVATLFVQPMLDAGLERPTTGPMAPGSGEKAFGPLLNQRLADEVVEASSIGLVDAVVDSLVGPPLDPATGREPVPGGARPAGEDAPGRLRRLTA